MCKVVLSVALALFGVVALVGVSTAAGKVHVLPGRVRAVAYRIAGALRATNELGEHTANAPVTTRLEVGVCIDGRYQVERFLGRGASGRVFRARDLLLDRTVCLKEVVETVAVCGDLLLDEARAAARIRHPNVVTVFDVVPRTGGIIIVTELLPGSLEDRVARDGPLSLPATLRVLEGILAGLEALHGVHVVHRDLKPANVFLMDDGTAKIGDFGISIVGTKVTLEPGDIGIKGTAGYLAPEVLTGQPPRAASDVYSVGRTMERIMAGDARKALAPVMRGALAHDPRKRFASAAEMRRALRDVVGERLR